MRSPGAPRDRPALDADTAARFAALTLGHLTREWPYRLDQTLSGPSDLSLPKARHPMFFGSFDWHSCVHGWWQVLTLLRLFPDMPPAGQTRSGRSAIRAS